MKGYCRKKNHEWTSFRLEIVIPYCKRCGQARNFKPRTKAKELFRKLIVEKFAKHQQNETEVTK